MTDPKRTFLFVGGMRRSLAWLIANSAAATSVQVYNCPGLTALPELPAATFVRVHSCPGLTALNAGNDKRGYQFVGVRARGQWRIIAGCRNYSISDARKHWGPKGPSDRPDCLALVEKLAAEIGEAARC